MEQEKITCQGCSNECRMEVYTEDGEVMDVTGNRCMKGYAYAQETVNMHR